MEILADRGRESSTSRLRSPRGSTRGCPRGVKAKERDGNIDLFSGTSDPAAAHIFPFATSKKKQFGGVAAFAPGLLGRRRGLGLSARTTAGAGQYQKGANSRLPSTAVASVTLYSPHGAAVGPCLVGSPLDKQTTRLRYSGGWADDGNLGEIDVEQDNF